LHGVANERGERMAPQACAHLRTLRREANVEEAMAQLSELGRRLCRRWGGQVGKKLVDGVAREGERGAEDAQEVRHHEQVADRRPRQR
jgi:hypothetical protein